MTYQPISRQTYWYGLLGCGNGVINNELIICFSETHQLLFDPLESEFMSVIQRECRDVILVVRSVYKQSREKHRHLSFTFKTFLAIGKKRSNLKYQSKMAFQISFCHPSRIIVNKNE